MSPPQVPRCLYDAVAPPNGGSTPAAAAAAVAAGPAPGARDQAEWEWALALLARAGHRKIGAEEAGPGLGPPAGIGLHLELVDGPGPARPDGPPAPGRWLVSGLTPGGAAEEGGQIRRGDWVAAVDGRAVGGLGVEAVSALIRAGPPGSTVDLDVRRPVRLVRRAAK
jgi:hypothetical protein